MAEWWEASPVARSVVRVWVRAVILHEQVKLFCVTGCLLLPEVKIIKIEREREIYIYICIPVHFMQTMFFCDELTTAFKCTSLLMEYIADCGELATLVSPTVAVSSVSLFCMP